MNGVSDCKDKQTKQTAAKIIQSGNVKTAMSCDSKALILYISLPECVFIMHIKQKKNKMFQAAATYCNAFASRIGCITIENRL